MELIFLGSGSAFTIDPDNYQSNMIFKSDSGKVLLIDCGGDVRHSLKELGYSATDIDSVYISHLHADHTGGLEWLGFSTFFNPTAPRPKMFINKKLSVELWNTVLKGGMGSIEGEITELETYFDVNAVSKNGQFEWEGISFRLIQVVHYMDGYDIVPSYGLIFSVNNISYFLTTDTQFNPNQIKKFYNDSDVIFQDAETAFKSGVHAHYSELITLDLKIKNKMWLYHYNDDDKEDCTKEGFQGWIVKGQIFPLG